MRRDTLVFTVAGIVFGLVVGYMAASWDVVPRPAAIGGRRRAAATAAAPATKSLNPDEVAALESLAARQPGDASVRVELGNLYMDAERWDEAIRWYREALAVNPALVETSDGPRGVPGQLRPAGGGPRGVRAACSRADPGHRNALYNKGIALLQMGRAAEAAAAWEELLKRHPADPQLQGLRGRIEQIRATASREVIRVLLQVLQFLFWLLAAAPRGAHRGPRVLARARPAPRDRPAAPRRRCAPPRTSSSTASATPTCPAPAPSSREWRAARSTSARPPCRDKALAAVARAS